MLRYIMKPSSLVFLAILPYATALPAASPILPIGGPNGGVVDTSFENIQCNSSITGTSWSQQERWTAAQGDLASSTLGGEFTFNTAVRQQAQGRYDNFASIFFNGPSGTNLNCGIENSDCGSGPSIVSGGCPGMYAAGWEILTSFTSLDHVVNNLVSSFETALTALNIAQATNDFFPSQSSVFADQEIVSAVAGILGLIGGLVGLGEETALTGTLISGISGGALGFAGTALGAPPPTPGNLTTAYSQIHDTTIKAYNEFAEAIFANGSVDGTDVSMSSLMANGALLVEPDFDDEIVTTEFQKAIYAQLAVAAWAQTTGLTPFITWDDAPCNNVASLYLNQPTNVPGAVVSADFTQVNTTIDNRCYYLLGAQTIDGCSGPTDSTRRLSKRVEIPGQSQNPNPDNGTPSGAGAKSSCWNIDVLPGGTDAVLDGTAYNGLLVADFLSGAVAGWTANGNANGYPTVSPSTTGYPQSIQNAGFITQIPVCDYRPVNGQASKAAGKNCPDLTAVATAS